MHNCIYTLFFNFFEIRQITNYTWIMSTFHNLFKILLINNSNAYWSKYNFIILINFEAVICCQFNTDNLLFHATAVRPECHMLTVDLGNFFTPPKVLFIPEDPDANVAQTSSSDEEEDDQVSAKRLAVSTMKK